METEELEERPSAFLKKEKTLKDCAGGAMKEVSGVREDKQKCGSSEILKEPE